MEGTTQQDAARIRNRERTYEKKQREIEATGKDGEREIPVREGKKGRVGGGEKNGEKDQHGRGEGNLQDEGGWMGR